jgi:hypothetical protein
MSKKPTSVNTLNNPIAGSDPREIVNGGRRDFLDFLAKSSSSAVALAAVGSLAACGGSSSSATAIIQRYSHSAWQAAIH